MTGLRAAWLFPALLLTACGTTGDVADPPRAPIWEPATEVLVPGYEGRALAVEAGRRFRIVDVEGGQICDFFAVSRDDPSEVLHTGRTMLRTWQPVPEVEQVFFSSRFRPMVTFVDDRSPGVHDWLVSACDPQWYEVLDAGADHPNCHDNVLEAAGTVGLELASVPGPVNFFQPSPATDWAELAGDDWNGTEAGDYVELRAEMDLWVIATACSFDVYGGTSTPIRIDVLDE